MQITRAESESCLCFNGSVLLRRPDAHDVAGNTAVTESSLRNGPMMTLMASVRRRKRLRSSSKDIGEGALLTRSILR